MGSLPYRNLFLISLFSLSFILILSFSSIGCKESVTNPPPDEKPPGYQEDIPWPSLADSPWPVLRADMQRTGRSKFVGPQLGVVFTKVPGHQIQTGITFGSDSVFYFGTSARGVDTTKLVAAKTDGSILWSLNLEAFETTTTPLVDNNGTIYITNGYFRKIFAVNPNGTIKWIYNSEREIFNRGIGLGKDGTLYVMENGPSLIALNNEGHLLWKVQDVDFGWGTNVNLTFSPDGKTLYYNGNRTSKISLIAFDITTKSIKWKFGTEYMENGPMVDSKGNIYVLVTPISGQDSANFYCINPDGKIKWKFSYPKGGFYWCTDPTIDRDGNIYFAGDTLYALNYSGELRWKLGFGTYNNLAPLICDAQGTVFMAVAGGLYDWKICSVSRSGTVKWILNITDELMPGDCPAINNNGLLVYPTFRSQYLLLIK